MLIGQLQLLFILLALTDVPAGAEQADEPTLIIEHRNGDRFRPDRGSILAGELHFSPEPLQLATCRDVRLKRVEVGPTDGHRIGSQSLFPGLADHLLRRETTQSEDGGTAEAAATIDFGCPDHIAGVVGQ